MATRCLAILRRRLHGCARGTAAIAFALVSACASAPFYRPVAPPFVLGEHAEAGLGAHAAFGQEQMSAGAGAWLQARLTNDLELVVRGHGADIFGYGGPAFPMSDLLYGGSVGLRGRFKFRSTMTVGGELLVDYQERRGGNGERLASAILGVPIAEQAVPGLWVYTEPSFGVSVSLQDKARVPMFGFQEIPLGLVWQPAQWLLVIAEGGMSLPVNGGYGGAAMAFRF